LGAADAGHSCTGDDVLSEHALQQYFDKLGLSQAAQSVIRQVRQNPPARQVTNGRSNMAGVSASRKTAQMIQWESWTGERALVVLWEHDVETLEYWDQPCSLKVNYHDSKGVARGTRSTPDYLLLHNNFAGFVDYRGSSELQKAALNSPGRIVQTAPGTWDQVHVRESAQALGLGYRLISELDIPHVLLRNLEFLRPKLLQPSSLKSEGVGALCDALAKQQRVPMVEAIRITEDPGIVYAGHFAQRWALNLSVEPLAHIDSAFVYRDALACQAYTAMQSCRPLLDRPLAKYEDIGSESMVLWDGRTYAVVHRGGEELYLRSQTDPMIPLKRAEVEELIGRGKLEVTNGLQHQVTEGCNRLRIASPKALHQAIEKLKALERYWKGETAKGQEIAVRTLHDWQGRFRAAEARFGNGFIGLINNEHLKGNRTPRASAPEIEIVEDAFKWLRADLARNVTSGYAYYVALCEQRTRQPISSASFHARYRKLDQHGSGRNPPAGAARRRQPISDVSHRPHAARCFRAAA
jgi:putative transposase